jgi:hypothetical protein
MSSASIADNPPRHDLTDQGVTDTPNQPIAFGSSDAPGAPLHSVGPAEDPVDEEGTVQFQGPARPGVPDVNRAINVARKFVRQAAHKSARDATRAAIVSQVAGGLGAALNKVVAPGNNYGPPHFVDEGVQIMGDGYTQAAHQGVMDAADDFDWSDDDLDQNAVDQVDASPDKSFQKWGLIAGMVGLVRAASLHSKVQSAAEAQRPFLTGLLQDGMTTDDPQSLSWRFSLFGGTIVPIYEQGYGAMGGADGRIGIWHSSGDAHVCGYCSERDGQEYPEDQVGLYPGDGDFGEACDGGPNCRCWLEWVYPGETGQVAAGVQVDLQKFYGG